VSKNTVDEKTNRKEESETPCVNEECNYIFKGKVGKFCLKCGAVQDE
jgi:hypothetical protein